MNTFGEFCLIILPSILVWHLFAIFVWSDSRFQQYRLRKALDLIVEYITNNTKPGHAPTDMSIIYKNKKFSIGIMYNKTNSIYGYYDIYINGELAATLHRLRKQFTSIGSTYLFEEVNKRHRSEVTAILFAAARVLRQKAKPKKIKKDGWAEYSYFNY